jgi:DNA-binding NarL/FixJ family response regulator
MQTAQSASNQAAAIPVVLVEDIRLLRDGISALLDAQGLKVVAEARTSEDALHQVRRIRPALVLVNSAMSARETPRLVEALKKTAPETKIVVMDVTASHDALVDFVRAGASGFILKDASADDFMRTVHAVLDGACVLPPALAGTLFTYIADHSRVRSGLEPSSRLTQRERQVCELVAIGMSNKEIASRLNIAVHTVKSHVHSALEKLNLRRRVQIAASARLRNGGRGEGDRAIEISGLKRTRSVRQVH